MRLLLVAGARPNFMKLASLVDALEEARSAGHFTVDYQLVHTGQHYDDKMSSVFFSQLGLPQPHHNLEVGSATHAEQTAEIMKRFEPIVLEYSPDVVVVVGDVNSTIACALVASKTCYEQRRSPGALNNPLIAHVEAGLRSFDRTMPEEINRVLTDAISDLLFVTESSAIANLEREGHSAENVFLTGNTMVDTLLKHREAASSSQILERLEMRQSAAASTRPYALLTLHRPSNVDHRETLQRILEAVLEGSGDLPVIFPIHPRTAGRITDFGLERHLAPFPPRSSDVGRRFVSLDALPYLDFLCLMDNAAIVLTDSGGIQEETTVLSVPCVTLRDTTERPITLHEGTNLLAGTKRADIVKAMRSSLRRSQNPQPPKLWDGQAGRRIVRILKRELERAARGERVPGGLGAGEGSGTLKSPSREARSQRP